MASVKEIKTHINSVKDTQKITNAMYLIASAKMRKAKAELDATRPYFNSLQSEIKRVFRTAPEIKSKYFYPGKDETPLNGPYACLVITADKGLAGAYNQNVERAAQKMLQEHEQTKLLVVGECGRQWFSRRNIQVEQSFLYTAQNPTMQRAREISQILLEMFENKQAEKIFVIYTDIKNGIEEEVKTVRLLPFHRKQFASVLGEKAVNKPFEFLPSLEEVLDAAVPSYVSGFIYSALVDSFCSEQSSRMAAMDSANRNAEKILNELSKQYNSLRQAIITREITEISAGARAQKLRKKEAEE